MAAYRRVALQLHYDLPRDNNCRSVLLLAPTACKMSVNGSFILSACLAQELGRPVLMIDASAKRAAASQLVQCASMKGFTDLLRDPQLSWSDLVMRTDRENVSFLSAGTSPLGSHAHSVERVEEVLCAFGNRFDFVVLSGGSVLEDGAGLALAPHVGCVLLMAVENETKLADLDNAQNVLGYCKARRVGLIFTTGSLDEKLS